MAGTVLRLGAIQVFVAAEDHPPPHVHVAHGGEGWTARFRFSFLSDVAGLYRFRRRELRPTLATLNAVSDAIVSNLPACRTEWWTTHGARNGLGLVNRRIETRTVAHADGVLARVAVRAGPTGSSIVAASYDIRTGRIALSLADGRRLSLTAGRHIEEAEEW